MCAYIIFVNKNEIMLYRVFCCLHFFFQLLFHGHPSIWYLRIFTFRGFVAFHGFSMTFLLNVGYLYIVHYCKLKNQFKGSSRVPLEGRLCHVLFSKPSSSFIILFGFHRNLPGKVNPRSQIGKLSLLRGKTSQGYQ